MAASSALKEAEVATVKAQVAGDGLPPGPRLPRPLQSLAWLLASPTFMDRCHARYGDLFTLRLNSRGVQGPGANPGESTWVFLAHPDHIRAIFTADPAVVRAGETNVFLEALVGSRSILVLDEPEHMPERRLLLPPLHGDRVARYGALMAEVARAEVARWPRGEALALWPRMQAITLEVIVRAVFGITEADRLGDARARLRNLLNRMTSTRWLATQTALSTVIGPDRSRRYARRSRAVGGLVDPVDDLVYDEIRRRRTAPDLEDREDILSLLLRARYEDGGEVTDAQLRDELVTLLIAGHESTATALAWAFERLVRCPEVLAHVREEAERGGDAYADAVVKETLRLRPVLPFVLRKLAEPVTIGGHGLPAGTWVAPCAYLVHRRAELYPEPDRFVPERFLGRPGGSYTWIPFGGGVRRCLGASFAQLEMRKVLQAVALEARLRPSRPREERIRRRFVTLAPARGAHVVVEAAPRARAQ